MCQANRFWNGFEFGLTGESGLTFGRDVRGESGERCRLRGTGERCPASSNSMLAAKRTGSGSDTLEVVRFPRLPAT
jgi:hypothetical protein